MPHQVDRSGSDLLDEGDHVSDVLRHLVIVTDGVPMLGKEVPQADRDHAMRFRQRAEHSIPGEEIAERAVHADQRRASSHFEIGHVVTVDAKCLHDQPARKSRTTSEYFCGACSNIGCVAFGMIAVFECETCAASACSTFGSSPLVRAPRMNSVGILIDSASAFENGGRLSRTWPISVKALSRRLCFTIAGNRGQVPGPSSVSTKTARPPSTSPAAIFSADAVKRASSGEGPPA